MPSSPGSRPSGSGAGGDGPAGSGHGSTSSYGNTLQMMELAHVGRALFDEAAAGGSVLRGLMMGAGRLQIAFSAGEGGLTGLLSGVGGAAMKLASPLALASASLLGFGAAATYGFNRYEEGQEALQVALNGRGRFSGLTPEGANRLAASSALTGGLSVSEGTSLTAGALGAGLTPGMVGSVVDMSRDFGRLTGKSTDEPGKMLTAAQEAAGGITSAGGHLASVVEGVAANVQAAAGRLGPAEAAARQPYGTLDRSAFGGCSAIAPQFTAGGAFGHAPADIQSQILVASMRTGMSPGIVAAIGERESGFHLTGGTNIKGPDGRPASSAYGFGQLTNGAAADVARVIPGFSKMDPNTAVLGAAEYLKIVLGRHGGDMQGALDAYGTGPGYGADVLRRAGGAPSTAAGGTMMLPTIDVTASPRRMRRTRATHHWPNREAGEPTTPQAVLRCSLPRELPRTKLGFHGNELSH